MKKFTALKKFGMSAAALMMIAGLTGCPDNPVDPDDPVNPETVAKTVFDPEATDTYKVYATYEGGAFSGELVKDTDYVVEDGMLKITPNGWDGGWIVLNEEVDCKGATKAEATLASDGAATVKMGLNLMASDPEVTNKVGSSNFVANSTATPTKIEGAFGKAFVGEAWPGPVKYKGKESVKFMQVYGQDTSDWSATTKVKVSVGKVVVYVPTEAPADDPEDPIDDPAEDEPTVIFELDEATLVAEEGGYKAIINLDDAAKSTAIPKEATITISYDRPEIAEDYVGHYAQVYGVPHDGTAADWDKWSTIKNWMSTYPSKDAGTVTISDIGFEQPNEWATVITTDYAVMAQVTLGIQLEGVTEEDEALTITNIKISYVVE